MIDTRYRSPEWVLAIEAYIAVSSVIIGACGNMQRSQLGKFLYTAEVPAVLVGPFIFLGFALFLSSLLELRYRNRPRGCDAALKYFSDIREWIAAMLMPFWACAVMIYPISGYTMVLVPALSLQALVFLFVVVGQNIYAQHCYNQNRRRHAGFAIDGGSGAGG